MLIYHDDGTLPYHTIHHPTTQYTTLKHSTPLYHTITLSDIRHITTELLPVHYGPSPLSERQCNCRKPREMV